MGGFTTIKLKNFSEVNIEKQNDKLKECKVAKKYRFYSENDVMLEYEAFCNKKGVFPDYLFPRHKIKSYKDFKKYWNSKKLGTVFVPEFGTLTFDCYFNRTSKRAMKNIAKYLLNNINQINSVSGSFSTFVERCGYGKEKQKILMELEK